MRVLTILALCFAVTVPARAYNEDGSLAVHLVASNEYLECSDLCPVGTSCLDVDCDLTLTELEAVGGYGYACFIAYNVEQVAWIEFFVTGWPVGQGTPDFLGPHYCAGADAILVGEPFEKRGGSGGAVIFPCEEPCSGMFCFAYISFGPSIFPYIPITIEYSPSSFSYPDDPHNIFQSCTEFIEDPVQYEHGAVIGGECEPIPNCEPGPTAADGSTWGMIKGLYR